MTPTASKLGLVIAASLSCAATALGGGNAVVYTCPAGDAVIRRTDSGNNGPMLPDTVLPDVIELSYGGWQTSTAATDPFTGSIVDPEGAHLFRLQLKLSGLVNPPGTLGLDGQPWNPFQFGDSPLYGFVELDVDDDEDTGGEQPNPSVFRPLANASRFGGKFTTGGDRQAICGTDLGNSWYQSPQFMLSGADWSLVLCGCFPVTVISTNPPGSTVFGPGQTWVVQGRFFQRAGAYVPVSAMTGGSVPGAYDAPVCLQFKHDIPSNVTSVSLVYPLDQIGAGLLAGHASQPIDTSAANDTSIAEGITDLINRCNAAPPGSQTYAAIHKWAGHSAGQFLDPTEWRARFIVGTSYSDITDGLYVYTDVGPNLIRGDVNGDGVINGRDRLLVQSIISQYDGGPSDADGAVNGQVLLFDFPENFSLYDINYGGAIGPVDLALLPCPGDFNGDGRVTVQDIFDFLSAWFSHSVRADYTLDGNVSVQDIFAFLAAWFGHCP